MDFLANLRDKVFFRQWHFLLSVPHGFFSDLLSHPTKYSQNMAQQLRLSFFCNI
jgi:hypothetical protein